MDRIQTAIEKARAQRSAAPQPAAAPAPAIVVPDTPAQVQSAEARALWSALHAYHPDAKHLARTRIVAFAANHAAIPFDVMRTKLLYQMRANSWRRVAITSPGVGCGKTMTAINLAFSLARQTDIRTLLIELDLRRPSMASVLGVKAPLLFASVLEGGADPAAHMLRYGANMAFATNHRAATNPAELLQGTGGAAVIDTIEASYKPDMMIFDMPPMLVSDDTMGFLDQVDCCLLVGAAETTTIDEIDKCSSEIATRTNLLGVILNKCRFMEKAENYGY